ncbi:MAG: DUF5050 domain-containing protein, partial [Lachnospiraceae bacterium]|nr:DUF5050 domain-containing protein [Lachnospiraceae bacterium]
NYSDGILYGILDTENEELKEFNGDIAVIEIDEENSKISENFIENRKPADICVVNGVIYYSDKVSHKFLGYNPETDEETVLVDDKVYYPIIYKDLAVFQNASDGESLYSVSLDSGEITKLNDTCSYWPIVYKDKIYYQGLKDAAYTLRCMKLDGTADMELAGLEFETPVICGNKLCFVDLSDHRVVSFLDLENPDAGIQKLDIEAQLLELMMKDEYIISSGEDLSSYKLNHVSKLSYINGCLVFDTLYKDENGDYFADDAMYNFDTGEVSRFPWDYIK